MQFDQGANGIYSPVPKFRAFALPSGVNRLLPYCTINSTAKLPILRYTLKDANATELTPWTFGETLDLQNYSSDQIFFNQGSPCLGYHDDSVRITKGEGGPYYQADNNTFGNVGTDDLVIRCLVNFNYLDGYTGTSLVLTKVTTVGYELSFSHSAKKLYFYVCDSHGIATVESDALDLDTWYWISIYADRSGSCRMYVNGVAQNDVTVISGNANTLDSASPFILGYGNMNLAYLDMHHGAAWLDTDDQSTHAQNDFARICGVYPDVFGTTNVDTTDASPTMARAFPAYLEKYNTTTTKRELHYAGPNWMRVESKKNTDAGGIAHGFLSEKAAENLIVESEDFSATWTLLGT